MERITWDQFFMAQCHLLAVRSTCTRLAVGATIVRDNRIIAGGYNGSISGGDHCIDHGCYVVDNHCVRTIHAEMNALLQCSKYGIPVADSTLYVTHFPCLQCSKAIIQAGIRQRLFTQRIIEIMNMRLNYLHNPEFLFSIFLLMKRKLIFPAKANWNFINDMLQKMQELGVGE